MNVAARSSTRGATSGDVVIFLATISVAAALLYPAWSVRDFRARVESATSDVSAVATAARTVRDQANRWPTPTEPGEAPPELVGLTGADGPFGRIGYTVGWTAWEVVDSVDAPPPPVTSLDDAPTQTDAAPMVPVIRTVGAVTVHSSEEALLAELLARHADGESFVLDTMWILVLPERAQAIQPR